MDVLNLVSHSQVLPVYDFPKHGSAFQMLKDCLNESENSHDIRIWAVAHRPGSMRRHRHSEGEFLGHFEGGVNGSHARGTLGMEGQLELHTRRLSQGGWH